jgi:hypothetical protein
LAIADVRASGNASADDAELFGNFLSAALVDPGKLRVVERARLATVMKEHALAASGVMSDDEQARLALRFLGARYLVIAELRGKENGYRIGLSAIDSSTAVVAFKRDLAIDNADQLQAGARKLASLLHEKLTGVAIADASEPVGDFDPVMVKEAATRLANLIAARFPQATGKLKEVIPNGTSSCSFADPRGAFATEAFAIGSTDFVKGHAQRKGKFVIDLFDGRGGCSGRFKATGLDEISDGDSIVSLPVRIAVEPLRAGPGTAPEVADLFSNEVRESLKSQPMFEVAAEPQLRFQGSISGNKHRQTIELKASIRNGTTIELWTQTEMFALDARSRATAPLAPASSRPAVAMASPGSPPPPALGPAPASGPVGNCLARDAANDFVVACVTAVNVERARLHGLTRVQLTLTNKTGNRVRMAADGGRQYCGTALSDAPGNAYGSVYGEPCGLPSVGGNPPQDVVARYVVDKGEILEPGKTISRQFLFYFKTEPVGDPQSFSLDLALFVLPESGGEIARAAKSVGLSLQQFQKR